jgi:hypothetical protein
VRARWPPVLDEYARTQGEVNYWNVPRDAARGLAARSASGCMGSPSTPDSVFELKIDTGPIADYALSLASEPIYSASSNAPIRRKRS